MTPDLAVQAPQGPMRAEDLFREWYRLGEVRTGTAKFWDHQLAVGQRFVSTIHLEVQAPVQAACISLAVLSKASGIEDTVRTHSL